ncbi:RNA-binding cell elongation regulator Jag/EloR [Cellulosilyticum ruminicola]|uniref:RNA-binding cell elongation regulator Jag/EloR n=1 Tax=Cellulosilyticum ruminicola TaxID=425254 RepID=UPI0006D1141E|nr:RNA-binding cell elongation regulator Jag/EloR [Cellulosilyticum ruminicola]
MRSVEKVGKTVNDAVTEALIELGASTEEVDIEIITKGSKGLLGFGARDAKVRVTLKAPAEVEPQIEVISEVKEDVKVANANKETETVAPPKSSKVKNKEKKDSEDAVVVTRDELAHVQALAEEFLYKLLREMNIEATVKSEVVNNNRLSIGFEGKSMGVVIGKRGETLDAIQYIVNIVANKGRTEYVKIMLDTENYRARREETLKKLAYKLSKKAQQSKKPIILEPMNPYDRRIIHSALQDSKIVKTHSEGKEPFRRVVITPNYQNKSYR